MQTSGSTQPELFVSTADLDQLFGEMNRQREAKHIMMTVRRIKIMDATPVEAAQSGSDKGTDGTPTKDPEAEWPVGASL